MQHRLPLPPPEPMALAVERLDAQTSQFPKPRVVGGPREATGPSITSTTSTVAEGPPADAEALSRGIERFLNDLGYQTLTEFRLVNGRRADVVGLDRRGRFAIVEIKASAADFRADHKWPDYLPYSDDFYFGVAGEFPMAILPDDHGVIAADAYSGVILRPSRRQPMKGSARAKQILEFALVAGARLRRDGPV